MKSRLGQLREYYTGLCPLEHEWVHEQLAEERLKLEEEIDDLKRRLQKTVDNEKLLSRI